MGKALNEILQATARQAMRAGVSEAIAIYTLIPTQYGLFVRALAVFTEQQEEK